LLLKNRVDLITPTYFPAISSTGTNAPPLDFIGLVSTSSYPRVLVSAYDLAKLPKEERRRAEELILKFREVRGTMMLDSGSFESFWHRDMLWTFEDYARIVRTNQPDFYCSFDRYDLWLPTREGAVSEQLRLAEHSAELAPSSTCILVVHGPAPSQLTETVSRLLERSTVPIRAVAIPERECGGSLSVRAETVARIRMVLDQESDKILLHLLGCGHPLTMAVYTSCGAGAFDSQDWSQVAIDRTTLGFMDPAHIQLLECRCGICKRVRVDNYQKTLLHNLLFYQDYALDLQRMIRENTLRHFLMARLPEAFYGKLEKIWSGHARVAGIAKDVGGS